MRNNSDINNLQEKFNSMSSEEKILKIASGLTPPEGRPQKEVLNSLLNKIDENTPVRKLNYIRYLQAIAALIILLVCVKVVPSILSAQQLKTAYAEQAELLLPDGTEVMLNADSKIKWNKRKFNNNNNNRYLTLSGEAYFDVKKGNEFIIKTNNGTIEILGTQLNIFSREDIFWVSCISGKVKVSTQNSEEIITPGEWVKLNDSGLLKSKSETIEKTILWKEGVSHFEDTQLDVIFDELERQFNVSIEFIGNKRRKATLNFSNKNLNDALDLVCIPMDLNYEVKNNRKIIISEKN